MISNPSAFVGILVLAVLIEGIMEYLGGDIPTKYKKYAAALVSIGFCLAYDADLLATIGLVSRYAFVGNIFTGLVIGRGSNYLAMFAKWLQVIRAPAQPVATVLPPGDQS